MLYDDRTLLNAAIHRIDLLHPTMRTADLDGWLDRLVYLCRLRNPDFGRKRNPSGRISPNTLGIRFGNEGHFIGVDIARDGPNTLRPEWIVYDDLGPHVDQEWIEQTRAYAETQWGSVPPAPVEPTSPVIDASTVYAKLDVITAQQFETYTRILALDDRLAAVAAHVADARDNAYTAAVEGQNIARRLNVLLNLHFPDVPID